MMNNKLTTESDWEKDYEKQNFCRQSNDHSINILLNKYIPAASGKSCLEIGSYPGPFLATLGDKGYKLNGVDFNPNNDTKLPLWLKSEGLVTEEFWVADFFEFKTDRTFDVVASFGFIEHFTNYEEVIEKHAALVNGQGWLVITTPNFKGSVQHFLHSWLDKENLKKHYLPSMNPDRWASLLSTQGFDILYKGYFGGFWFWYDPFQKRNSFQKAGLWFFARLVQRLRKLLWFESPAFSSYCGIVAKKNNEAA
jgi:2-polyprenyl-3-methyl-5-hydroxy-6-metoxy-1,4-benzoquinol methylase